MGELREGQKVKLFFKTDIGSTKELGCFVKEVYSDRLVLIFPDEFIDDAILLEEGDDVSVRIFTPLGIKIFDSLVLDSLVDSELVIEYAEEISVNVQRREYFRTKFETKVYIEKQNKKSITAYTIEISGGSIMFYSEEKFISCEPVMFILYMPNDRSIRAYGFILEKQYLPPNHYVICFTKIDERDRDRIIKKRFELMIKDKENQKTN